MSDYMADAEPMLPAVPDEFAKDDVPRCPNCDEEYLMEASDGCFWCGYDEADPV